MPSKPRIIKGAHGTTCRCTGIPKKGTGAGGAHRKGVRVIKAPKIKVPAGVKPKVPKAKKPPAKKAAPRKAPAKKPSASKGAKCKCG